MRPFGRRRRVPDAPPTYWNSSVVERIQLDAGVDRDTAAALWAELLVFLDMVAESKDFVSPPPGLDVAWHAFILHTRDYEAYCRERYGRIIHHQPTGGPDPSAYRRAHERRSANRTPVDHTIWPLPSGGAPHRDDDGPSRPGQSGDFAAGAATIGGGDLGDGGHGEPGGDFEDGAGGQAGGDFGGSDSGGGDSGSSAATPAAPPVVAEAATRRTRPGAQPERCATTLTTVPLGSRSMKRRTPHSSSRSG